MKQTKPTPNRKRKKAQEKTFDEAMVKASVLTGFMTAQATAIEAACRKVADEKKDEAASRHCQYFLDGARELAKNVMDMLPPIKASDLIKGSAAFVNNLSTSADKIAADCKINKEYVDSYINGARKMSDILIAALVNSPRETIPPQADGGDTNAGE